MHEADQAVPSAAGSGSSAAAPADETLVAFLADRDVACPRCRYNLRGVTASACPECGSPIALDVAAPSRFGGRGLFLVAALLVVLVGASMGAARQWREAVQTARAGAGLTRLGAVRVMPTTVQTSFGSPRTMTTVRGNVATSVTINGTTTLVPATPAPPAPNGGAAGGTGGVGASGSPGGGGRVGGLTTAPVVVASQGGNLTLATSTGPVRIIPAAATTSWSAVKVRQWVLLGVWGVLGAGALVTLAVVGVLWWRKRAPGAGWRRAVFAASVGLFALFGVAHLTLFVMDMAA